MNLSPDDYHAIAAPLLTEIGRLHEELARVKVERDAERARADKYEDQLKAVTMQLYRDAKARQPWWRRLLHG